MEWLSQHIFQVVTVIGTLISLGVGYGVLKSKVDVNTKDLTDVKTKDLPNIKIDYTKDLAEVKTVTAKELAEVKALANEAYTMADTHIKDQRTHFSDRDWRNLDGRFETVSKEIGDVSQVMKDGFIKLEHQIEKMGNK